MNITLSNIFRSSIRSIKTSHTNVIINNNTTNKLHSHQNNIESEINRIFNVLYNPTLQADMYKSPYQQRITTYKTQKKCQTNPENSTKISKSG